MNRVPVFLQENFNSMPVISSAIGGTSTNLLAQGSLSAVTLSAPCLPLEDTGQGLGPHPESLNIFITSTPAPPPFGFRSTSASVTVQLTRIVVPGMLKTSFPLVLTVIFLPSARMLPLRYQCGSACAAAGTTVSAMIASSGARLAKTLLFIMLSPFMSAVSFPFRRGRVTDD